MLKCKEGNPIAHVRSIGIAGKPNRLEETVTKEGLAATGDCVDFTPGQHLHQSTRSRNRRNSPGIGQPTVKFTLLKYSYS